MPDLEDLPVLDEIEVPSFLNPPSPRDCPRKLRSSCINSRVHPFEYCEIL